MKPGELKRNPAQVRRWQQRSRTKALKGGNANPPRTRWPPREALKVVWLRTGGLCCCGCGEPIAPFPLGYHHTFPKAMWPELSAVLDNIVGVAANCHANQETGFRRLPRKAVACVEHLATTGRMKSYLERSYANTSVEGAAQSDAPLASTAAGGQQPDTSTRRRP